MHFLFRGTCAGWQRTAEIYGESVLPSAQQTEGMLSFEYPEQNIVRLRAPIGMGNNGKFTRWLSFEKSVKTLWGCLGAVISCLLIAAMEWTTAGRANLHVLLKKIASSKFIATTLSTYILAGCIGIICLLSTYLAHKTQDMKDSHQREIN